MGVNGDMAAVPERSLPRLDPGSHSSPEDGVCIVELASVIGGEEFSDRPDCVDPVIAAFLRAWNDRAGHADRQRLAPYAERIVGTRSGPDVTRARRDICLEWAGADLDSGLARRTLALVGMRTRIAAICGVRSGLRLNDGAGEYAAREAFSNGVSERAFKLLDALLADEVGEGEPIGLGLNAASNGQGVSANGHRGGHGAAGNGDRAAGAANGHDGAATNGATGSARGARGREPA